MRINDGSICNQCFHFNHECYDTGCEEYCDNDNSVAKELFCDDYDYDKIVIECPGFKKMR